MYISKALASWGYTTVIRAGYWGFQFTIIDDIFSFLFFKFAAWFNVRKDCGLLGTLCRKKMNSRQRRACLRNSLLINPFTVISSYFNHHLEGARPVSRRFVWFGVDRRGRGEGLPAWGSLSRFPSFLWATNKKTWGKKLLKGGKSKTNSKLL